MFWFSFLIYKDFHLCVSIKGKFISHLILYINQIHAISDIVCQMCYLFYYTINLLSNIVTTTWLRTSAWGYLKGVSSLTSLHYLWRSLGPFSLSCAQKWPVKSIITIIIRNQDLTTYLVWGHYLVNYRTHDHKIFLTCISTQVNITFVHLA